MAVLNYMLLYGHWLCTGSRRSAQAAGGEAAHRQQQVVPRWHYALWALADVEANYLVVWAYQYTSIASVMLLDCFTIPCVMVASRFALGARYRVGHVLAACVCVVGLMLTVLSDVKTGKDDAAAPHGPAWIGDLMAISSAALYALSNVQQEMIVKRVGHDEGRCEALGKLGLWGCVISGAQVLLTESGFILGTFTWTPSIVACLIGYEACLFIMYTLTSKFLTQSDAAVFNLSLLTSDVYSVLFAWRIQHQQLSWLYASAFGTTLAGIGLYYWQPEPSQSLSAAVKLDGVDSSALLFIGA